MKLAFTTLACPGWTLERAAAGGRAAGYEGLELRLLDGELVGPDLSAADRRRVRNVCAAEGLALVCLDTSVRIAQPEAGARERQVRDGLAMLELAAELGAPLIRVFAGPPEGTPVEDAVAGAVACLAPLAERGSALGVAVALETHDAFCDSTTVARVLEQVPGTGAGALWDLLHPYRIGEPYDVTLGRLRHRLLHVHVKDGRPPAGGGSNWELTLLGEGAVPTRAILAALRASGYDGWVAVEWEKKWHPELAEPEVALPQHADLLRQYLNR
ncbi:MAG TPA: sugar phosphate isomerase/epimerase family protein [Roseiflexaceae bacterium]|nr:sugar phosphate isomerase/epimerase family protein [Roseiflexaceae bacterium]